MINVEIWSDLLCPFCYIGKRRFESALLRSPLRDQVVVQYRSFELDPNAKRESDVGIETLLARKYGRPLEWVRENHARLEQQGAALGLAFDFERLVPTNSFDAHRLLHLSRREGREEAMLEALFAAYFTEGQHIGRIETFVALAEKLGLDGEGARKALLSQAFAADVRRDEDEAQELGLSAVPAFVFNRRFLLSGAQPEEVFSQALQRIGTEPPQGPAER